MKPVKVNALHVAMGALAAASVVAGCNESGSGAGVSALAQAPKFHSIHRLDQFVSTKVKVFNQENGTLTAAGNVPECWTASPSPVPTVSASPGHSPVITETYDTTCAANTPSMSLEYTLFSPYTCVFTTTYNASGTFSYSQTGLGPEDNCFVTPAPRGDNYDEKLVYTVILGAGPHKASLLAMHKTVPPPK
jgi:hypothetical protein